MKKLVLILSLSLVTVTAFARERAFETVNDTNQTVVKGSHSFSK